MTHDLEVATYSLTITMTLLGEQETMTKATARPYRIGQLVNHRHANSVVTTSTIAPRHAMPQHGERDHDGGHA